MTSNPPLLPTTARARHNWKFFRLGGLDQASLRTAADLRALDQLDQKLWVALSCPVKGLEIDEKTLALIDTDHDGHIRAPELIAAVNWAADRLRDPATMLRGADSLALSAINDATADGKVILSGARQILASLGQADAQEIHVTATDDVTKLFAGTPLNGDGVITVEATTDADAQALINDIIATVGGVADRTGATGVSAEKVTAFYAELNSYVGWLEKSAAQDIAILGPKTEPACSALRAVRAKVDDYFARCRLAAFDPRAIAALNREETDYLAIAAKDLSITAAEIAAFPLARIAPHRALPLTEGVNPAWSGALATVYAAAVTPIFGADKTALTEDEWRDLSSRFAPYEGWLGNKVGSTVEKIGLERSRELLAGKGRAVLEDLLAKDKALEPEYNAISAVDRLVRYHRDLRALLQNFVNFVDFYSPDRLAVFQAGTLYIDSRSCELCIRVEDPAAHAVLATSSKAYIAYMDCRRVGGRTMKIAACVTQGDSDYLSIGRNGIFYDRKGEDWDATITKIIENPISLRQAFWSPYKKFVRMIEAHVAQRAAAADAAAPIKLGALAQAPLHVDPAKPGAPKKIDVGTVAALGVAVGAIGGAIATVATGLTRLALWQLPLVIIAIILVISLPAVVIAWLKLRQRTLGPILDANGWAVNGRVRINLPFGTALTARAVLPPGSQRSLKDPYAEKKGGRRTLVVAVILFLVFLAAAKIFGFWPFSRDAAGNDEPAASSEGMN